MVIKFTKSRTMPGRHSGDQVHKVKKNAAPPFPRPLSRNGESNDFVCLITATPGRCFGDQARKVKKTKPLLFVFLPLQASPSRRATWALTSQRTQRPPATASARTARAARTRTAPTKRPARPTRCAGRASTWTGRAARPVAAARRPPPRAVCGCFFFTLAIGVL